MAPLCELPQTPWPRLQHQLPWVQPQKQRPHRLERSPRQEERRFPLDPVGQRPSCSWADLLTGSFSSSSAFSWARNPMRACTTAGEGGLRGGPATSRCPGVRDRQPSLAEPRAPTCIVCGIRGHRAALGAGTWPDGLWADLVTEQGLERQTQLTQAGSTAGVGCGGWVHGGGLPRPDVSETLRRFLSLVSPCSPPRAALPVPPPPLRAARGRLPQGELCQARITGPVPCLWAELLGFCGVLLAALGPRW